jgi:hypothetical protein
VSENIGDEKMGVGMTICHSACLNVPKKLPYPLHKYWDFKKCSFVPRHRLLGMKFYWVRTFFQYFKILYSSELTQRTDLVKIK